MCLRSSVPRLIPLVVLPIRLVAVCGSAPGRGVLRPQGPAATPSSLARVATPSLEPCRGAAAAARAQLPAVTLCCLGGGPAVPLGHLLARSYIANLWASWCMPCQRAAPRLVAAAVAAHGDVDFLGIDTRDDRVSALDFRHHVGISYPQLADPRGGVGHHLGLSRILVTLALDAGGRIVYRRIGEISAAQFAAALHAATPALPADAGAGG